MKKNMIIPISIILLLVILLGIIGINYLKNKPVSIITLDINPSIEIGLNKKDEVVSIKALNEDAKNVISDDLKGKSLDTAISDIADSVIAKGYIEEDRVVVLIHSEGQVNNSDVEDKLKNTFGEKRIDTEVITIEKINKEDEKLANKYNISASKAAYINSIKEENENVPIENIINKPVEELKETKNKGLYCDEGYTLDGNSCKKEISREAASAGIVCPRGYYEYKNICYQEGGMVDTGKLFCFSEFTLQDDKCYRVITDNAIPTKFNCEKGEAHTRLEMGLTGADAGDANQIVCVDYSKATHPVTPCELPASDPTERMSYGGKCYWHRAPVISTGCPGKIKVNGECWDDATNIYICAGYRDGKQYKSKDEYCEHSIKYYDPVVTEYKCEDDFTLNDTKCIKEEIQDAEHEWACANGYTLVDNDKCINYDDIANKENGYYCNNKEESLRGNMCITYERIDAKR